jgi:hypothetical protein
MMIKFEEEEEKTSNSVTTFKDVPLQILQAKIFQGWFSSKELFKLRQVCGEWSDTIKSVWCHTVKEEMLE